MLIDTTGVARLTKTHSGVYAYSEHRLLAFKPVSETPSLGAIGRQPQLKTAAVGELHYAPVWLGRAD